MHIPENYLSPSTCAVMTAAMLPVWGYSIHKIKTEIPKSKMPLLVQFTVLVVQQVLFLSQPKKVRKVKCQQVLMQVMVSRKSRQRII